MKLSTRLANVLALLDKNKSLVDIGCDHGYLSIEFAKLSNNKVYAIDNKKEPLDLCIQNVKEANLENNIETILSDGLVNFNNKASQIAICGMGGNNIIDILDYGCKYNKFNQDLILALQPNNNEDKLRKFLNDNKFKIIDEVLVSENDIIYEIIKAQLGTQKLNENDIKFGPIIRKNKNDLFIKKWNSNIKYLNSLIAKIPENIDTFSKIQNIKKEIKFIEDELNEI